MEPVPLYLSWYFLRIRRHRGERGYLSERANRLGFDRALLESQMLKDLFDRGLIMLPLIDSWEKKVYDPLHETLATGVTIERAGTQREVPFPAEFDVTPMGHYFLREAAASLVGTTAWTALVALMGAAAAVALGG